MNHFLRRKLRDWLFTSSDAKGCSNFSALDAAACRFDQDLGETRRDQWNKEKSAILAWEGTNRMQRPLQDILLMSSSCLSNAQLLADSVRPSNIQSRSWHHYHPQPSLPTHVNKEKFERQVRSSSAFQHSSMKSYKQPKNIKQPPATSCWFLLGSSPFVLT